MTENHEDLLLSRAIDRKATADDWRRLERIADVDASVWARLAETLRDDTMLAAAMRSDRSAADEELVFHRQSNARWRPSPVVVRRLERLASLVLVGLGLWWLVLQSFGPSPTESRSETAEPDDILALYVESRTADGSLLEQLPNVTLSSSPTTDGRLEVVFVRRLVERAVVRDVWSVGYDEHGQPVPVRLTASDGATAADF